MLRVILFFICLLLPAVQVIAETVYVTDKFYLTIYELPDNTSQHLKKVTSGEMLTVIERTDSYIKVRTGDGVEGWAKAPFLVTDQPASLKLQQLEEKNSALTKEHQELTNNLKVSEKEVADLKQQLASFEQKSNQDIQSNESLIRKYEESENNLEAAQQKVTALEEQLASYEKTSQQNKQTIEEILNQNLELLAEEKHSGGGVPLVWIISALVLVLILGFIAGLWWLDYKIRKRHGGYRIY